VEVTPAAAAMEAAEVATDGQFHFSRRSVGRPGRRALTSEFAMHGEAPSLAGSSAPTSGG
jgi:hypothetical protein